MIYSDTITKKYLHANSFAGDAEPLNLKTRCGIPWTIEGEQLNVMLKLRREWALDAQPFGFDAYIHPVRASFTVSPHPPGAPGLRQLLVGVKGLGCDVIIVGERHAISRRAFASSLGLTAWDSFEWEISADLLNFVLGLDMNGSER